MRTVKFIVIAVVVIALAAAQPANAQLKIMDNENTKLFMTLHTAGAAQALSQKNVFDGKGAVVADLSPGFQNALGDLGFIGRFGENGEIEVVFDMYLSSRNHPSTTYGNEGYILMRGVPENLQGLKFLTPVLDKVNVKAGQFLIGFGDAIEHRSNNAIVQKNPLVGNFVIDPNIVSIAMEVSNKPGRYNWLVGVSNGTTTEDFSDGRGFGYHGKLAFYPVKPLRTSISYIAADQSKNPPKGQTGGSSIQMFSGNRSGERYAGVLGGGQAPGGVFPQAGEKFSAAQFDVTWDGSSPIKLYGHYGITQDKDINGSLPGAPEEKWSYYSGQVVYRLTPALYGAARYSAARTNMLQGKSTDGKVDRIQIGGGFWLTKNLLMKLEYVDQKYRGFNQGEMVNNGIQAWREPSFKGFISEVSFAF